RLIRAASQFIQTWLNRQVALGDWQESRDGTGGQRLAFANIPVVAVLSLSIDGLDIPPAPSTGGFGAGYVFSPTELALRGYVFTRRAQNVIVTYTAGYVATPPDIAPSAALERPDPRRAAGPVHAPKGGARIGSDARRSDGVEARRRALCVRARQQPLCGAGDGAQSADRRRRGGTRAIAGDRVAEPRPAGGGPTRLHRRQDRHR